MAIVCFAVMLMPPLHRQLSLCHPKKHIPRFTLFFAAGAAAGNRCPHRRVKQT
jgi:hypothetical protein